MTSSRCQQTQEKAEKASSEAETKAKTSESETKEESTSEEKQQKKENEGQEGEEKTEGEEGKKNEEKGKKDMPPPPPHGDKTPWQVFMETMQTEFQASKEWNESTKALSGEIQTLQESERVKKARQAYESTTGAISSTTSTVVKGTAGAIGKGAAWTWDTAPVKGVRKVANVTGEALDKATKPLRETEAYKNVKNVIDDGSSSRYGGWVEKEERRKKREAELQKNPSQVFEEDPK